MVNNHRLDLISPRVLKITVTHAVCTRRCWTLSLLRFERERMQLVYEFILLNKISRNRLLSEHMQLNYASFNVKSNRLTSISFNKIIKVPKYFICDHSFHVIPLIKTIPYLSHARSRFFSSLRDIFGSRQLKEKHCHSWLLAKPVNSTV